MSKRVPATATYLTAIRGAVETATQRRWTITAGALRSADRIPSFPVDICSKAVCELTHRRVTRRHFPPLLRLLKADTRMGHGHTPSPPARPPQLAAEPPHSEPQPVSTISSLKTSHSTMTRSISFNKIQLHSLCLFNRGKSIFLGTTCQLHYVQKNLNNGSRCIEFRLICAWLNLCTLTIPLSIALSATILLSWSFFFNI